MKGTPMYLSQWKRAILIVLPLLVFWMGVQFAAPAHAAVITNTSIPINLAVLVPCANGGTGELVLLSGSLHLLDTITLDGHGGFHAHDLANPQGVRGVGLATGLKYQGVGQTHTNVTGKVGFTSTFVNVFNIIGQGPGNNFKVHETVHVTVNANGTETAFVDHFLVTCK